MQHRVDIQIVRGLAVVLVVLFHLNIPFFSRGFLGVDAFFVISGFLMALLYRPGSARDFFRRPASRLLPAYIATVIAILLASTILVLPSENAQVVTQGLYAAIFASNVGFWLQDSYFSKVNFNPMLHLWSLGVEIQFYLIVPLLAWIHTRGRFFLLVLALGSLAAALVLVVISPKTAFFLTPFRVWQFLAGAAVARYLTLNGAVRYPKPGIGFCAFLVILLVAMVYPVDGLATSPVYGHPAIAAILVTSATAGVLAFGLPNEFQRLLPGVALSKLGDWSYSIYLAHFPVIVFTLYVPFSGTILSPSGPGQTVALVGAIGICSGLLYLLFDRPRNWKWTITFRTAGALMLLTVLVASVSGPLSRIGYSAQELNILGAFSDRAPYRCGIMNRVLRPRAELCELTQGLPDTAPVLLFVGDSHADAIKTSFARVAQQRGVRLFFTVSNVPLISSPDTSQLLAQATAIGARGIVLHYMRGNDIQAYDTGFVSAARQEGIAIGWLLPVPIYAQSVPQALWNGRSDVPLLEMEPVNLALISQMKETLDAAGIPSFDPRSDLCRDACLLQDDEMHPFYFDVSHLTLTGSRQLEPLLRQVMDWFDRVEVR